MVDLERRTVEVYEGGVRREYAGPDRIGSAVVPQLMLTVDELFARKRMA